MSMNWKEPETKAKLLLAILASQDENALSGAKAAKIAEYMGCTAKAVTHQLTALRKELAEFKAADGQVVATPAKKRKAKGSDGEDGGSPTKKTKPTPKKRGPKAKKVEKVEVASDDEDEADGKEDSESAENGENDDADEDVKDESN